MLIHYDFAITSLFPVDLYSERGMLTSVVEGELRIVNEKLIPCSKAA